MSSGTVSLRTRMTGDLAAFSTASLALKTMVPTEAPGEAGAGSVERVIGLDGRLSNDQKETLIRIYRGFVEKA